MRGLPVVGAVLLLPLFIWWGERHYQQNLHGALLESLEQGLAAPEFAGVEARLDYFVVTLEGMVATPLLRFDVERMVNALPGLRLKPDANRVVIPMSLVLSRKRDGDPLVAEGLVTPQTEGALVRLLQRLDGRMEAVAYHSHVMPGLDLSRAELGQLLEEFFSLPGERRFSFEGGRMRLEGSASSELRGRWQRLASALGESVEVELALTRNEDLALPLPMMVEAGRVIELEPRVLSQALSGLAIFFEHGAVEPSSEEREKIPRLVELLEAAGAQASFVIGGHADATGNAAVNRRISLRRAERVKALLVEAGLSPERFEVVSFGAEELAAEEPAKQAQSRRVEVYYRQPTVLEAEEPALAEGSPQPESEGTPEEPAAVVAAPESEGTPEEPVAVVTAPESEGTPEEPVAVVTAPESEGTPEEPVAVVTAPPAADLGQWVAALAELAIFFDHGMVSPNAEERKKIPQLQELLEQMGTEARFVIGGHADASGNPAVNQRISLRRAERVKALLVASGLAAERFEVVSFGTEPVAPGEPPKQAQSRRVEVYLEGAAPLGGVSREGPRVPSAEEIAEALAELAIYFDHGMVNPNAQEREKILQIKSLIDRIGPDSRFTIGGHADATGNAAANRRISLRRAERVKTLLVETGLDPERFEVVSFGAEEAATGSGQSRRQPLSRRVELYYQDGAQ